MRYGSATLAWLGALTTATRSNRSGMGGNASLIGASANMVTAGIADRAGYRISYLDFIKVGLPAMILTVAVGMAWLFIRF